MSEFSSLVCVLGSIYIPNINIKDIIEIVVLTYTLYKIILSVVNTRAMVVIKGIGYMAIVYLIAYIFNLNAILIIFQNIITVCMFAVVLIFQPELRRMIERIGTGKVNYTVWVKHKILGNRQVEKRFSDKTIESVVDACVKMSKAKTGALIVFEKEIPLTEYITSGIPINADVSSGLLVNIFEKNTPLHDGAVIMLGDKVVSATCYLPLSKNADVPKDMGTRHRAGIGVSEVTDCFVVTVSEETGDISFIYGGVIEHGISGDALRGKLKSVQIINNLQERTSIYDRVRASLKSNLRYKIISIIVGVIGWLLLMNVANPVEVRTLTDMNVTVINDNVLTEKNKTYELDRKSVDITISSTRRELDRIKKDNISVIADLNKITYANAVELEVYSDEINITEYTIRGGKFVQVEVDDLVEREFNIENKVELSEGIDNWAIENVSSNIKSLKIHGGSKTIDKIGSVVAIYKISEPSNNLKGIAQINVFDKNGDEIQSGLTLSTNEVELNILMRSSKRIPVNINVNDISGSSEYSVWQIKYSPESVEIMSDTSNNESNSSEYLDSIEIPIDIDVNTLVGSNKIGLYEIEREVHLSEHIPSGVTVLSDVDVIKVKIQLKQTKERTIWVPADNIEVRGLSNDKSIRFTGLGINVVVIGEPLDIDKITSKDLGAYIDVQGKEKGNYLLDVIFTGETLKSDNVRVVRNDKVSVEISLNDSGNQVESVTETEVPGLPTGGSGVHSESVEETTAPTGIINEEVSGDGSSQGNTDSETGNIGNVTDGVGDGNSNINSNTDETHSDTETNLDSISGKYGD